MISCDNSCCSTSSVPARIFFRPSAGPRWMFCHDDDGKYRGIYERIREVSFPLYHRGCLCSPHSARTPSRGQGQSSRYPGSSRIWFFSRVSPCFRQEAPNYADGTLKRQRVSHDGATIGSGSNIGSSVISHETAPDKKSARGTRATPARGNARAVRG